MDNKTQNSKSINIQKEKIQLNQLLNFNEINIETLVIQVTLLSKVLVKKVEQSIAICSEEINIKDILSTNGKKVAKILFQKAQTQKAQVQFEISQEIFELPKEQQQKQQIQQQQQVQQQSQKLQPNQSENNKNNIFAQNDKLRYIQPQQADLFEDIKVDEEIIQNQDQNEDDHSSLEVSYNFSNSRAAKSARARSNLKRVELGKTKIKSENQQLVDKVEIYAKVLEKSRIEQEQQTFKFQQNLSQKKMSQSISVSQLLQEQNEKNKNIINSDRQQIFHEQDEEEYQKQNFDEEDGSDDNANNNNKDLKQQILQNQQIEQDQPKQKIQLEKIKLQQIPFEFEEDQNEEVKQVEIQQENQQHQQSLYKVGTNYRSNEQNDFNEQQQQKQGNNDIDAKDYEQLQNEMNNLKNKINKYQKNTDRSQKNSLNLNNYQKLQIQLE